MKLFEDLLTQEKIKSISEDYREIKLKSGCALRLTLEQIEDFKDELRRYIKDTYNIGDIILDEYDEPDISEQMELNDINDYIGNSDVYFDAEVIVKKVSDYVSATYEHPEEKAEYEFIINNIKLR